MTASAGPVLKQLYREYGDHLEFLSIYVREAHPGERYPQARTLEQKLAYAREYKARDDIPWQVAVDDLEGTVHRAFEAKPNSLFLIDRDGTIAFRALWANDTRAVRNAVHAFASGRPPEAPESQAKMAAMLRGIGHMYDILRISGEQAKRDFARAVPPIYGLAWLAGRLPLPKQRRGFVAAGLAAAGLLVAAGGATWARRRRDAGRVLGSRHR